MKVLILLAFALITPAIACKVILPQKILILSENPSQSSLIQSNNCTDNMLTDLNQILMTTEGRVAAYQIQEMMQAKDHQIDVQPAFVIVENLRTLVRNQIILPTDVHIKAIHADSAPGMLGLSAGDRVEVSCSSCLNRTQQTMNVTIFRFDGSKQGLWATIDLKKMVKAYRLVSPVTSFQPINNPQILKEEYVEEIPQSDLISDRESLGFFITNKPLRAGDLLKRSDLNAVNLVRAGTKTEVILENQMVRIRTSGISRENGSIGDLVEVYHPQKNKKYQGKVIDNNKVLVEL